ncbi:MAG: hypothetical protein LC103_08230 [Anaerolineales bacterium]|nr:hypothetical protein [Anaerolineales bacterium]
MNKNKLTPILCPAPCPAGALRHTLQAKSPTGGIKTERLASPASLSSIT